MEKQKKIIYEYVIKHGKLIKLAHETEDSLVVHKIIEEPSKFERYLYWYEIKEEHIIGNHIFSFHDDIDRIRNKFLEHYQNLIETEEEKLERFKKIYMELKEKHDYITNQEKMV